MGLNDGLALSAGVTAIFGRLRRVAMDYAFVLPAKHGKQLPIVVVDPAFLVGFESPELFAWAIIADVEAIAPTGVSHVEPEWWSRAKAIDANLRPMFG